MCGREGSAGRRGAGAARRLASLVPLTAAGLLLILTTSSVSAQDPREAQWRADLQVLVTQLELRHPDLYHSMPRERFRSELQRIEENVASLSDDDIAIALARLLAGLGDGHTLVPLMWDRSLGYSRLPVELARTADGVSVLAADSSLSGLAGSRVLRIGSLPATAAMDSLATLVSRDNEWTALTRAAEYATVPEMLHGLGITGAADRARLLVEDREVARREVVLQAVDREAPTRWDYGAYEKGAPWLDRREDPYWLTVLPGDSVAYVQFNRADRDKEEESLAAFGRRLLDMVRDGSVRRIVLDLRWNRGGSRWRARHLLGGLIAAEHALGSPRSSRVRDPAGHLVTLIGPNTFSAAAQFALDLELHTNTAFVGLPTGGKPNHFGEVGRFRLPRSELEIRHSVYYHQAGHARDTRPAIFPDRRVRWTADDVLEGRDPALDAALGWRPLPSARGELERRIRDDGVEAALAWLDRLAEDPVPTLRIMEGELNRLGYDFLGEDRAEIAAAIFRRNLEWHPWSANTYDSLADALLALGREREANRLLCRAFAIDPQFDRALERGVDCRRTDAASIDDRARHERKNGR